MKVNSYKKIVGGIALALMLLASLPVLPAAPVAAHMPGADPPPEFELEPIVISDGGVEIEITIEDVGNYHNECMEEFKTQILKEEGKTDEEIAEIIEQEFAGATGICPCSSCAFRAADLGISQLWGDEIPERSDIKIITHRPTPGATQCLQYITGTGTKVPNVTSEGELQMVLADGTEVADLSVPSLKKHAKNMGIETWSFIIIRKSTGEQFEVQAVENLFPEDFSELRDRVKVAGTATPAEIDEFRVMWEEVRDAFLTQPDWVLFEGIEEPEEPLPTAAIAFSSVLIVLVIVGFVYSARGRRR
jgi:hypothetical protein